MRVKEVRGEPRGRVGDVEPTSSSRTAPLRPEHADPDRPQMLVENANSTCRTS